MRRRTSCQLTVTYVQLLSTEPFITLFLDGRNTKTEEKEFSTTDDAGDNLEEVITTGC